MCGQDGVFAHAEGIAHITAACRAIKLGLRSSIPPAVQDIVIHGDTECGSQRTSQLQSLVVAALAQPPMM